MQFWKYHGLGNDFIVLHTSQLPPHIDLPQLARTLCDRHFSIGADGLLIAEPAQAPAHARMIIYNSDGSRPQMCGNGLRCFALHLALHHAAQNTAPTWIVETDAGQLQCTALPTEPNTPSLFSVTMGPVSFGAQSIHVQHSTHTPEDPVNLQHGGHLWTFWPASMGNPHAVLHVEDPHADLMALAKRWGPALSTHSIFEQGANIEWVRPLSNDALEVVVYERGAGLTFACGTGACASAAVAVQQGWLEPVSTVHVTLPGGPLRVQLPSKASGDVILSGAAEEVFGGVVAEPYKTRAVLR